MKKIILILLAFLVLSNISCSMRRSVSAVPTIAEGTPKSTIVIIRNYNFYGAGIHFWPTLNGQDLAGLYTNQYTTFELPEGAYRLGVRCHGGWIPTFKHYEIDVKIEANRVYYYLLSPKIFPLVNVCGEIESINEQEGKERQTKAKFIPTGSIAE